MNKLFVQEYRKFLIPGLIVLGGLLLIFALLTGYYLYFLNTPANKVGTEITFVVTKGDGVRAISVNLEKNKLVSQDFTFMVYLKLSGLATSIQAGEYKLSGNMTPRTLADVLTKGKVASRKITIPEGWTIDDIGTYLEKQNIVTKASFDLAAGQKYNYEFLADKPANVDLEGFLFPDTYQISQTATADSIVKLMLSNFDGKLDGSTRATIKSSGMNTFEVVTLASVVEREVAKPEDRKVVAGIFLNRLETGMALESDATIQYILKSDKRRFSYEQTRVESPYNTYIHPGLPVGPIGNPGIDSIKAVLYPEKTSYLYFFSADDITYYSKTLDEHEANIAKYLK